MFLLLSISRVTVLHASESAFRSVFSGVQEDCKYGVDQIGKLAGAEAVHAAVLP